jgi:hypothetical protein
MYIEKTLNIPSPRIIADRIGRMKANNSGTTFPPVSTLSIVEK